MKPYIPIKVYRWYNKDKYKIYIFDKINEYNSLKDNEIHIKEFIYIDDNLDDALNKIILYINHLEKSDNKLFYFWNKNNMLSHNIKDIKWDGFKVNPFESTKRSSKLLDEDIVYIYNVNQIFDQNKINLVFSDDLPSDLKENKYYFIDKKIQTYKSYKSRDEKLFTLVTQETKNLAKYNDKYHRVDFTTKLKSQILLSELYDNLHTYKNIALIQWVNDNSKILYKMQKKHFIKHSQFINWCNIDKINKTNCINIYYIITTGCYCKITIDSLGYILFSYIIDIRKNISWEIIIKSKKILLSYLKRFIKEKINLNTKSIKLNTSYIIDNVNLNNILSIISKYLDIFIVNLSNDKQQIICIYKRSVNYTSNINISDYILSRFEIGVSKEEIINELILLDFDKNLAKQEVENILESNIDLVDKEKKKEYNIKDNGTIVIISKNKQVINIEINNCANFEELNYLLYWLSKIISQSRVIKTKKTEIITKKENVKINIDDYNLDNILEKPNDIDEISDDNIDNLGELDYNLDDDDDDLEMMGGAMGKDKHSYFVDLMKMHDKDLVSDNYARDKCQSGFQPIILTKTEKEELEKNKMTHYDNILEYGSHANKKNFFICPKLWCPISKIPLDHNIDNYKCPLENEEPIEMFWGKDKNKKRYIKLIKPNEKGLCAPCCGKKAPKDDELKKCKYLDDNIDIINDKLSSKKEIEPNKSDKKDDINTYLMNQKAPIPNNRFGSINEKMHNLLLDSTSYNNCSKMLNKTQKCLVRKGIVHRSNNSSVLTKNDSLIYAIANILGFKGKNKLIDNIISKLDIITYISLEDGNICKDFMDINLKSSDSNLKLIKKFNKTKSLNKLFRYDKKNKESVSKILNIFKSYNKFINYLRADDYPTDKSPYYLYSLIAVLYKKLLIIWENNYDDITILCPLFTTYNDIITNLDLNPQIIMLLKDGRYYEPIELRNKTSKEEVIKLNDYKFIKTILNECSKIDKKSIITDNYNNIYSLNQWIRTTGGKYNIFEIKTLLLNNDLTISFAITKSNILVNFDKISISLLNRFISDFNLIEIKFFDDILKKDFKILNIDKRLYNTFTNKCDDLKIKYIIGDITLNEKNYFNSILKINNFNLDNVFTINNIHSNNLLIEYIKNENKISYNWFKLQKLVSKLLITKYTDQKFIDKYGNIKRNNLINLLFKSYFTKYKNDDIIRIILEELPLYSSKPITNIKIWISNIIIQYKYDYMSYIVKEKKDELIYSQNIFYINKTFEVPDILLNYHSYMPNNLVNYKDKTTNYVIDPKINNNVKLPEIFYGEKELLPTKWRTKIKLKWSNMNVIKNKYDNKKIIDFIEWLSKYLNISITYKEIKEIVITYYRKIINSEKDVHLLFSDPSFYNKWLKVIKIKPFEYHKYIENYFSKLSKEDINDIFEKVIKNNDLYHNDVIFKVISDIFNISILLIHRIPHKGADLTKRNEMTDLLLSSTLIKADKNMEDRPLFIFQKVKDDEKLNYYMIMENKKDDVNIDSVYIKYSYVPNYVKSLIELHLKK